MATEVSTKEYVIVRGIVTTEQYIIILESSYVIWLVLSVPGIISNVINIRIFLTMGLRDGVTVSFLALSISDLIYVLVSFSIGISVAFYVAELKFNIRFPIEPYGVSIIVGNLLFVVNVTNVLITTFIAVIRCACVAKPLHFKNMFNRDSTIAATVVFAVFAVVSYVPILVNMGMVNKHDKQTNITRPTFWVSPRRESVKYGVWMLTDMILPFTAQFIILLSVLIMAESLRAASKFRNATVLNSGKTTAKNTESSKSVQKDAFTGKELRLVQQVILISVVYILCNTPKIIISLASALEPGFNIGKRYSNFYLSANSLRKHFEIVNSSVNTIIYYRYNTKFRQLLRP